MAVVQISKIQLRRGQKNSQSGIPQLSSAEMAWAVDTQELFIGNGSVSEGAPFVGNTKILTERDNILELAASYEFASDDTAITDTVPRSLQSKLDEIQVSVIDFGAVGNGITDNTSAFETAFTQLFNSPNTKYKKVLIVPNGVYAFRSALRIPSNVVLRGETQQGAILKIDDNDIRFVTSGGQELSFFNSTNRPRFINFSNLTISRTTGQFVLSGVADSVFSHIDFTGQYKLGDNVSNLVAEPAALFWQSLNDGIKTTDITFDQCNFKSSSLGVKATATDDPLNTEIKFVSCHFFVNHIGVLVFGVEGQQNNWLFDNCKFEEVATEALQFNAGRNTRLVACEFKNVGNGTGLATNPQTPMVYFEERQGNILINCASDRQQAAGIVTGVNVNNIFAVSEVVNSDKAVFVNRNTSIINRSDSFIPLAAFSADNRYYTINYFLKLGIYSRVGELTMSVSDDFSHVSITDHYQYSSSLVNDPGGQLMINFEFDAFITTVNNFDTIVLTYKNPQQIGQDGSISFDVTYGV
jgi:hypothetical protein